MQQIVAVVAAALDTAVVGVPTLLLAYGISPRGCVGIDGGVEDRVAVGAALGTAVLELGAPRVVA